jgi:formylglycine-generating enzyme required for sulfatase activity
MKKTIYSVLGLFFSCQLFANNLIIGTPAYNGTNNTLTFTVKWDNSWRVNTGPANYDAVWLFAKRQPCGANGIWSHALLSSTADDHVVSGTNANSLVIDPVSDNMGVLVHLGINSDNQIISSITTTTIVLKLTESYNPTLIGPSSASADNWKIFGIEMVYVPAGEFYIGDGRNTNSNNFSAGNTSQALKITNNIQNSTGLGAYSNYTKSPLYGCGVPIPKEFPLGYNGFYTMKYEISQGQMVDFYNTLTYTQQAAKMKAVANRVLTSTNQYIGNNNTYMSLYNSTTGSESTVPATFKSAYPHLPMGYMNWQDLCAYLDWSGLRPMTEFEYEKACRGNNSGTANTPIANEYPWGNTTITAPGGYNSANNATWNSYEGSCNFQMNAPVRSGAFATSRSNRSQSGASYYGIMELGGNLWEQCIGGGSGFDFSGFRTTNGDGILTNDGLSDVIGWPINGGTNSGTIIRGGYFNSNNNYKYQIEVSDRTFFAGNNNNSSTNRDAALGGRGVRSL